MSEAQPEENQRRILRALIAETQTSPARFAKELEIFAEAFSHTCGHNRLEQIGLRWSSVLTASQTRVLATDRGAAIEFASRLHCALMRHLLPDDDEIEATPKPILADWTVALRMGFQGVLRRRAYISGGSTGRSAFPQPSEAFLLSIQPTIRRVADEFFQTRPEVRATENRLTEKRLTAGVR